MDQTSSDYLSAHGKQIGRVVIGVGMFDDDITGVIAQSLRLNALQENALLRPMPTRGKADLLLRIARLFMSAENIKAVSKWNERVRATLDERNNLIHGIPCHVEGKVHFRSWGGKHRMLGQFEAWPAEKVSELADKFLDLDAELSDKLIPLFKPTFAPAEPLSSNGSENASPQTPEA